MIITLYHYTTRAGLQSITSSGVLIPSYRYNNLDTAHGEGHYFTNRPPATHDEDLFELWGSELHDRVRAYVAFQIDDSLVEWCRDGVYRLPLGTVLEQSINISTTYTDHARTRIMIKFLDYGHRENKRRPQPQINAEQILGTALIGVAAIGLLTVLFGGRK